MQGRLRADSLELTGSFALSDATQLLPAVERPQAKWTKQEFSALEPQLVALVPQLWEVRNGGRLVPPREAAVEFLAGDNVSFRVKFTLPETAGTITLRAQKLADLPPNHRQFVSVTRGNDSAVADKILSTADPAMEFPLMAPSTAEEKATPGFWGFFHLGVEHIWTGYDHLLFLFGLLVVCRSFRSIVTIITCFTVAHSLTLALATLNVVNLSPRLVEPAIAASSVFVGLENLWRRGEEPRGRGALTFFFGLIHGFGFASVLRDLGVGSGGQGLALPLFSFNFGVEVGQIAVASVALPIVWQLRKKPMFLRRGVPVLSAIVALAGLYWLLERTVFS